MITKERAWEIIDDFPQGAHLWFTYSGEYSKGFLKFHKGKITEEELENDPLSDKVGYLEHEYEESTEYWDDLNEFVRNFYDEYFKGEY